MAAQVQPVDVFINCPFDSDYQPIFQAILFTLLACGMNPRCALEEDNGANVRLNKIQKIIKLCNLGIHDISRTELDPKNHLPRFNMPFELGLFLGMKRGKKTSALILDKEPHRYQKFLSDIAGQDVRSHDNQLGKAVALVRNWIASHLKPRSFPGDKKLNKLFQKLQEDWPDILEKAECSSEHLTFVDRLDILRHWLIANGDDAVAPVAIPA